MNLKKGLNLKKALILKPEKKPEPFFPNFFGNPSLKRKFENCFSNALTSEMNSPEFVESVECCEQIINLLQDWDLTVHSCINKMKETNIK